MEKKRKPWSGLAIASLACGVLSLGLGFFMLGILAGIPAIVCGHLGRARIRKSEGGLRGDLEALVGLTIGYLMTAFSLLTPGSHAAAQVAFKKANVLKSRTMLVSTVSAVEQFHQEYSKLPEPDANDFNTEDAAGRKLLDMLLGPGNPRGVPFLVVETGKTRRKGGLIYESPNSKSVVGLFDAWGNPFRVILDDDYDEVIRFTYGGKPEVVKGKRVLVASKGPDGVEGTEDDLKSW